MAFPIALVMAGAMIADALVSVYNNYDTTKASNKTLDAQSLYTNQAFAENEGYWNDYYKNTGRRPLYPYRSGAVNDVSQLYAINAGYVNNNAMRRQSMFNVGTASAYAYGMYDSKRYHNRKTNYVYR